MRLDKYLANSGVGTRSEVRSIIKNKRVKVFQNIVNKVDFNVDANDEIYVDDKLVSYKPFVYIMLNKPEGYISATEDFKHKTVIDLLKGKYRTYDLFPVGRLDIDTTGLLILTNDGKLSHEILSPKKHIPKTYLVKTSKNISKDQIINLEKGVDIGSYITKSDTKLELLDEKTCYLTISEGKFHQVKKMFKAVSNEVLKLKRVKMNNLALDKNLKEGFYKELSIEEIKLLKGE